MKPHVLRTVPGLKAPAAKKPPMPGRGGGFYPARRSLLIRRTPAARQGTCVTNITNHLRLVNHLLVRVRLVGAGGAGPAAAPVWKTAGVVSAVLDATLREQLERELALMERGENIGANQRRRAMLRRTLETKPARIVRNFYAVQMRTLTQNSSAARTTEEDFYSDIVHERTHTSDRYYEQHTERVIERASKASPAGEQEVQRIADQVMRQLDKRMKLQRDRNGIW